MLLIQQQKKDHNRIDKRSHYACCEEISGQFQKGNVPNTGLVQKSHFFIKGLGLSGINFKNKININETSQQ